MSIQAVIFDVGNTLVNEYEGWQELEQKGVDQLIETMGGLGINLDKTSFSRTILRLREESFREARETHMEISANDCFIKALKEAGIGDFTTELINRGVEAYFHPQEVQSSLLPGVPETLRALAYNGFQLGIISNATSSLSIRRVLENHGILHWFHSVIISADVEYRKPRPEIFEIALKSLGIEPNQAVYVGNSIEDDIIGAKAAGIHSILLKPEKTPLEIDTNIEPEFIARDIQEVVAIVKKIVTL